MGLTAPEIALQAVHQASEQVKEQEYVKVQGCDYNLLATLPQEGDRLSLLMEAMRSTGFQATMLGQAIEEVNKMLHWEAPLAPEGEDEQEEKPFCKIFLGFTSNQVSCGNREAIRFLVEHGLVHVIVTTAGAIEEDIIKCLKPTLLGDWHLEGRALRPKGLNRIGNLLMPNENYCVFEDWLNPVLDEMLDEQIKQGTKWTPSRMTRRLGERINDDRSFLYWAAKNGIPVFSPAITDGAIGDMLYFHSYHRSERGQLSLDLVDDIRSLNSEAVRAACTGILCLGGGLIKHHICNANLMRNGADHAVFINTGVDWDGSDAGASPDEAVSWGKIKTTARPVKVHCEATLAFPFIMAESFAKVVAERKLAKLTQISETLYL